MWLIALSILLLYYPDKVPKVLSLQEISGSLGTCLGPFISSGLSYYFGYNGPFIMFGKYLNH